MRAERSDRILTLLLLAALAAPLAAAWMGFRVPAPFALHRSGIALLLAAVVATDAAIAAGARTWRRVLAEAGAFLLLAVPMAWLIGARANGFYTGIALLEGLAILLLVALVARTLRRLAVADPSAPRPAAMAAADALVAAALATTAALFLFAWRGLYEFAGLSLIVATFLALIAAVLRLPDSVRGVAAAIARTPAAPSRRYRRMLARIRRARRRRPGLRGPVDHG